MTKAKSGYGIYRDQDCKKLPKSLSSGCSNSDKSGKFEPQYHQISTLNYFINNTMKSHNKKGLLMYHSLGSGKTCGSIMIADELIDIAIKQKKFINIYVMTPGGLRQNFLEDYCTKCGKGSDFLKKYYTFITYNYAVQNNLPDFNDSLVIIDEVHNIVNGVKNKSKVATAIYKALLNSTCKILALSATPIFHYIYEWPILGNLLKPGAFVNILDNPVDQRRINSEKFTNQFNYLPDFTLRPKNPIEFKDKLDGIISYFPGSGTKFYPKVIDEPPIRIAMSEEQSLSYSNIAKKEARTRLFGPPTENLRLVDPAEYQKRKARFIMAVQYINTRKACNFLYPESYGDNFVYDYLTEEGGWVDKREFENHELQEIFSPKFAALFWNIIINNNRKHVIYTFFKEKAGANLLAALLEMCGISVKLYSGDVTPYQRKLILYLFNRVNNRYGEKILVLIITDAGAEGITLCEVGHMHILESNVRESTVRQAMGRVVRYKSHFDMPRQEQVVHIWRYLSVYPENLEIEDIEEDIEDIDIGDEENLNADEIIQKIKVKKVKKRVTTDVKLYENGIENMITINSFLELIKKASVNLTILQEMFGSDISSIISQYDY